MVSSAEQQIFSGAIRWIQRDGFCWFVTVISTHGASPRPVGSICAISAAGELCGSLSGGCVEEDLVNRLVSEGGIEFPLLCDYGLAKEENERLGLPCGGSIRLLVEKVTETAGFEAIADSLEQRNLIARTVYLDDGASGLKCCHEYQSLILDEQSLTQVFGPQMLLFLVGAGQLSQVLARMAQAMDYQVIVCDPRRAFAEQWPVDGVEVMQQMPDDAIRNLSLDRRSIVITLTHDPRIDDMALMEALNRDLFFTGALGSSRTSEKRRERLLDLGMDEAQVARLQAPVGIPIGSKTPEEIAVSILAELTRLRRMGK